MKQERAKIEVWNLKPVEVAGGSVTEINQIIIQTYKIAKP